MLETQDLDRRTKRHLRSKAEIVDAAWALARKEGIGGFSLRQLAAQVGMKAPSLYQYFETKNDLYDAMFSGSYQQLRDRMESQEGKEGLSRADIKAEGRKFFDFCTEDPVRYALMCERPVPGFEPSKESAALAEEVLQTQVQSMLANLGIDNEEAVRLFLAMTNGVVSQQNATNPGGKDWRPLMDRAIDLFLDHVGAL
jgi:AcrR family transcriptional regulator